MASQSTNELTVIFLQGDMGRFRLFLEKDGQPYDTFEVVPSLVINEATVLLRVLNADALDYETTQTLTFQVG